MPRFDNWPKSRWLESPPNAAPAETRVERNSFGSERVVRGLRRRKSGSGRCRYHHLRPGLSCLDVPNDRVPPVTRVGRRLRRVPRAGSRRCLQAGLSASPRLEWVGWLATAENPAPDLPASCWPADRRGARVGSQRRTLGRSSSLRGRQKWPLIWKLPFGLPSGQEFLPAVRTGTGTRSTEGKTAPGNVLERCPVPQCTRLSKPAVRAATYWG